MKKYLIIIAALAACLFAIVSCSSDNGSSAAEENLKKGMEYLAENAKREGIVTTASGLQYEVLREGTEGGKRPTANDYGPIPACSTLIFDVELLQVL